MPAPSYGDQIRYLRETRGWSQTKLGQQAGGLNKETVNRVEAGANVEIKTLQAIADALGVTMADVFSKIAEQKTAELDTADTAEVNKPKQTPPADVPKQTGSELAAPEDLPNMPHQLASFVMGHLNLGLSKFTPEQAREALSHAHLMLDGLMAAYGLSLAAKRAANGEES